MRIPLAILIFVVPVAAPLDAQKPGAAFDHPVRVIDSIPAPESVAIGPNGLWYVSSFGKFGVKGDVIWRVVRGEPSDTVRAQSSANGLFPGSGGTLYLVGYRTGVLSVTDGGLGGRSHEARARRTESMPRAGKPST